MTENKKELLSITKRLALLLNSKDLTLDERYAALKAFNSLTDELGSSYYVGMGV
jgi:hypothetical protein